MPLRRHAELGRYFRRTLSVVRLSGRTPYAFEIQCMIKRTIGARPLMRAGCRLALPFLLLSFATFAYSQKRPSGFKDIVFLGEIPPKPAMRSNMKQATDSDLKPAAVPI